MKRYYPYINILVIPTDFCNMRCKYCFHNEYHSSPERMTLETLDQLMKITIPYYKNINFIWHGGEPLSMGLDFYNKVIELQQKYNKNNSIVKNQIQSNLTMLSNEMADFLIKNNFGIGSSYDGIMNEFTRGNSDRILNGYSILSNKGKKVGIIQVVSKININYLIDSYEDFKKKGINYTINMYVNTESSNEELSISSESFVENVNKLFDYWVLDANSNIQINYFVRLINYILFKQKTICNFTSCLGKWVGIRPNGEITPCNRFFPSEYSYGNVMDYADIGYSFESMGFKNLLEKAIIRREKCKKCEIYDLCNGGCNNVALNEEGIENNTGESCNALKGVYKHLCTEMNKLLELSEEELNKYNPTIINLVRKFKEPK